MSDILYNKVEGYKKDGWVKYCTHDETQIKGFFGDFRFLSNFEPCNVFGYPSVENAYMAAKVIVRARGYFKTCSATEAENNLGQILMGVRDFWKRF